MKPWEQKLQQLRIRRKALEQSIKEAKAAKHTARVADLNRRLNALILEISALIEKNHR